MCRDAKKKKECQEDTLVVTDSHFRIGSLSCCVQLVRAAEELFDDFDTPFLLALADEDAVVDNQGAEELYRRARPGNSLERYPALHGLLCEPEPLYSTIEKDIVDWVDERCRS